MKWPDTSMALAFLDALIDWTARLVNDAAGTVMLPVGRANVGEVTQVLRALDRARAEKQRRT
jgi:hypothetical protein